MENFCFLSASTATETVKLEMVSRRGVSATGINKQANLSPADLIP